jgi:hypothetical protein
MMSLAASSLDGISVYWGGYAVCGCIKDVSISGSSDEEGLDEARADSSLFPAAMVPDTAASLLFRISVSICSEHHFMNLLPLSQH